MFLYNTNRKPYAIYGTTVNDLEWSLTRISRSQHFVKSNIRRTARLKDNVTIAQ